MEVHKIGRIHYIEPTIFNNEHQNGLGEDISFPYEDYCVSVDLSIETVDRYSCGWGDTIGMKNTSKFSTRDKNLSFHGGSKISTELSGGYLTTNFTDISMTDPIANTSECLGIESISITYDRRLFPQVVIKFTDVRGATLMQPSDYGYYNNSNVGNSRDIYKAFFTFPYPVFVLKVKGYYGKGITLKLNMYKTDFEFNSDTGNFNITASFTGHLYGLFADLPMTFIASAPYTSEGAKYWDEKIKDGTFRFRDSSGQPSKEMYKLPELRLKIAEAASKENYTTPASEGESMKANKEERISALRNLNDNYPFTSWEGNIDTLNYWVKVVKTRDEVENLKNELIEYYRAIQAYDKSYDDNYSKYFTNIKNEDGLGYAHFSVKNLSPVGSMIKYTYLVEVLKNEKLQEYLKDKYFQEDTIFVCVVNKVENFDSKAFLDNITKDINNLENDKKREEQEYKAKENQAIEKILGFRPSIRNIYDLMFAHMDTFLHCFYKQTGRILEQMKNNDDVRKKSYYGLLDEDTDTERNVVNSNEENNLSKLLPPYTAFYNKNAINGLRQMVWPEQWSSKLSALEEVKFIKDILTGAELYDEKNEEVDKTISASVSTNTNIYEANISGFIPITTYDYIYKEAFENPYLNIKRALSQNTRNIEGLILGIFALRAFYHLSDNKDRGYAKTLGRIEGINFFKALKDDSSRELIEFLKKYCTENGKNNFIKEITDNTPNEINKTWELDKKNNSLFRNNGRELLFNFNDDKLLPISDFNPLNIKNNLINYNESCFDKFLSVTIPSITDEVKYNSFKIIEGSKYIKDIEKRVEEEFKKTTEYLKSNNKGYGNRDYDEYGKINNANSILKNYKSENITFNTEDGMVANSKGEIISVSPKMIEEENKINEYYITLKNKLFDKDFFYLSNSIELKAWLFLNTFTKDSTSINNSGFVRKILLLKEGAQYWYNENVDNININGYKLPKKNETFLSAPIGELGIIKENENRTYIKYRHPLGCTPSRIKVLKDYFIEWAKNGSEEGFANNIRLLEEKQLYINQEYKNGLNIGKLAGDDLKKDYELVTNSRQVQKFLRDLFLKVNTVLELYDYNRQNNSENKELSCNINDMKNAFNAFIDELNSIYSDITDNSNNTKLVAAVNNNPFKNEDLKLALYIALKGLYDKWLCTPDFRVRSSLKNNDFVYIDSFHYEIGDLFTVNISSISNWLSSCLPSSNKESDTGSMSSTGKSLYQFLTIVAEENGAMLLNIPHKFGEYDVHGIKEMFTPMPLHSFWDTNSISYIFMYPYKPSEHLGDKDSSLDMNGYSSEGDGFDLTDEGTVESIFGSSGNPIPAFGVTYAKQNQSIFKNIKLNTKDAGVTDISIESTFNIASKASQGPRETHFFGQDIYKVYNQYAYGCSVETMGNAQITPLMYFQLNNIPLWKGAYEILRVNHEITPGNFITRFEGVKISKYAIPLTEAVSFTIKDTGNHEPLNNGRTTAIQSNINNTVYNVIGNSTLSPLRKVNFNENNISKKKPLICITPAHGPRTNKALEWEWSSRVVDKMEAILSKYTYEDGSSYNIQRCNKNGDFTSSKYSMKETQRLINILGSENVISVVPHWNGGGGQRYEIYLDYEGRERDDSRQLAECMKTEVLNIIHKVKNNEVASSIPIENEIKERVDIKPLPRENSDGAPRLHCACILTENWYPDYDCINNEPSPSKWDAGKYNGLFYQWLISEDGIDIIAQMHAKAIKRYIDSLN